MKNPKHQTAKPREVSSSKLQAPSSKEISNIKSQCIQSSVESLAGRKEQPMSGALVLKDELPNAHSNRHPFDLEDRTARFGEAIVRFSKKIPRDPTNNRLIDQLVGCGTSVGANYCEADERVSRKDFKNTIGRCVKEAKEAMFFLRMIAVAEPKLAEEARILYREAKELMLIFASIYRK